SVAHRRSRIVVRVDFADLDLAGVLGSDGVHSRRHSLAGTAPGSPEIHEYGRVGFQHVLIKSVIGKSKSIFSSHVSFYPPGGSLLMMLDQARKMQLRGQPDFP